MALNPIGEPDCNTVMPKDDTSWKITILFPKMPHDATALTMRKFLLTAFEIFDTDVAYEITKITKVEK